MIKDFWKNNYYLIFPIICIPIWALIALFKRLPLDSDGVFPSDILILYHYSRQWFEDPANMYKGGFFYYHPYTLFFIFIIFGFLSQFYVCWLNYFLNIFFFALLIIEVDKLLKFANLEKTIYRFVILMITFNGWQMYINFFYNTPKPFIAFVIIFLLRREIQFNQENREKSLKYYFINYFFLLLVIGMTPYFIYFFIIYVFYDIPLKNMFKKKYLQRYAILGIYLFVYSVWFIIFPNHIIGFLNGVLFPTKRYGEPYFFFLFLPVFFTDPMRTTLTIIIALFLLLMAIIITFMPKLNLQQKFSYYALFHLIFSPFRNYYFLPMLISLVMIIYIPFIKHNDRFFTFFKENILIFIGCSAISIYLLYIDYFSGIFAALLVFTYVMSIVLLHYFNWELTREIFFT